MSLYKSIGKYDIVRTLGRGGMGSVYQCIDPDLQRFVAVKVLHRQDSAQKREQLKKRFLREALATAQLQHPSIPPIYEVDQTKNGEIYYVMKQIEGRSLRDIIFDLAAGTADVVKQFDLYRLIEVLKDITQAVDYAHSKGLIHRDLKPSNIFVGDYGEVYVIDWGLTRPIDKDSKHFKIGSSKLLDNIDKDLKAPSGSDEDYTHTLLMEDIESTKELDNEPLTKAGVDTDATNTILLEDSIKRIVESDLDISNTLTIHGNVLGTLLYMPPEQALGDVDALGAGSDIYSLGVILYEMLTLKTPVSGDNLDEVINHKLKAEFDAPEIRALERDIPPELSALCLQSMSPKTKDRPSSAKGFLNALEFWLEGKTQFRDSYKRPVVHNDFTFTPTNSRSCWSISDGVIKSKGKRVEEGHQNYLTFRKDFLSDFRLSTNFIAYAHGGDKISEIAVLLNGSKPRPYKGYMDGYTIVLGAGNNTRATILKNDVEVVSNDYIVMVPNKQYQLVIEKQDSMIKVKLNHQVILYYNDSTPLDGAILGFIHGGKGVVFDNVKVNAKSLPHMVPAIAVAEALMAEKCYLAAKRRFVAISHSNKNRFTGAWACYRAGLASFLYKRRKGEAYAIWKTLEHTPYAIFERLGHAIVELENKNAERAIKMLDKIIDETTSLTHLRPIADIVFTNAQQVMRGDTVQKSDWNVLDGWVRLALKLGDKIETYRSMTPSILWRWLILALTKFPDQLEGCLIFLRKIFGEGKGAFAEVLITIEPLITILKRSASIQDHAFLVDKVMRLILSYDDNLGNLETLVRFYLNSGHLEVADQISWHIYRLCQRYRCSVPPAPIAYICCLAWLNDKKNARKMMLKMVTDSTDWGKPDGKLLLGLDFYKEGDMKKARSCWRGLINDQAAQQYNRHYIAQGLLGELPSDPVEAGVPKRSDHHLLYSLFMGFKHYADWMRNHKKSDKKIAVSLLKNTLYLMRPSYDIYSATSEFARIPLEQMGVKTTTITPEELTSKEKAWLEKLTMAASEEQPDVDRLSDEPATKIDLGESVS